MGIQFPFHGDGDQPIGDERLHLDQQVELRPRLRAVTGRLEPPLPMVSCEISPLEVRDEPAAGQCLLFTEQPLFTGQQRV